MAEIKVLVEGVHKKEDDKLRIGSTVTLIKSDKNIIVDTGSFLDKDKIIEELKKEDLIPEDIDIVILTHLHLDHTVNTYLFNNAKIYCKFRKSHPGMFHDPKAGTLQRIEIKDNMEIAKNVKIILTPGHTDDMISVVCETDKGTIVMAGDAISDESWGDLDKKYIPDAIFSERDIEKYDNSRKKIVEIADYIVPGHGGMFKVNK